MKARSRPCGECPFRRDTPPGQFPAERYAALESTHGYPGREASFDAPWFGCHKMPLDAQPGEEIACAGWLVIEGYNHLGVRIAAAEGRLTKENLEPHDDWPDLFQSYAEMAAAQAG